VTVVLCPLSVTDGWVSEINRFTPNLEVLRYVGDKYCRLDMRKSMYDHVKKSSKVSFELSLSYSKVRVKKK
jgi:SNF2 family DNA or RNA helicase